MSRPTPKRKNVKRQGKPPVADRASASMRKRIAARAALDTKKINEPSVPPTKVKSPKTPRRVKKVRDHTIPKLSIYDPRSEAWIFAYKDAVGLYYITGPVHKSADERPLLRTLQEAKKHISTLRGVSRRRSAKRKA